MKRPNTEGRQEIEVGGGGRMITRWEGDEAVLDARSISSPAGYNTLLRVILSLRTGHSLIIEYERDAHLVAMLRFHTDSETRWEVLCEGPPLWRERVHRS